MAKKIDEEQKESENYNFEFRPDSKDLLELSIRNVALVEVMIRIDSRYCRSFDVTKGPDETKKYKGSIAFWMTELKNFYESNEDPDCKSSRYREIIDGAVSAVDRENSTHLNSDGGKNEIVDRIVGKGKNILESLEKRDFKIVSDISEETKGGRANISFASKFCHYACMYLFEGKEAQDNFSIYDGVLRKFVPKYAEEYGINCDDSKFDYKKNRTAYEYYSGIIDEILKDKPVSRNGFDHLLWYYHKGRD